MGYAVSEGVFARFGTESAAPLNAGWLDCAADDVEAVGVPVEVGTAGLFLC